MNTAPRTYRLTREDSTAYCASGYHRPDIEMEVCQDLVRQRYFDLAEVVTTTGQTAFFYYNGVVLDV